MAANRIVSTGRRQDYPKETWGPRDRAREARLKQAAAGIRKPERWEPIAAGPPSDTWAAAFTPAADEEREAARRRQQANKVLEDAGVRARPWV